MNEIIAAEVGLNFPIRSANEFFEIQRNTLDQILKMREANKELNKQLRDSANIKNLQERLKVRQDIVKQLAINKESLRDLAKETRNNRKEFEASGEAQVSAYRAASQELLLIRDRLKDLSFSDAVGNASEIESLEKRFFELDTQLKNVDQRFGDFRRSVGDYRSEVNGAVQDQKKLVDELVELQRNFDGQPSAIRENQEALLEYKQESARLRKEINELGKTTGASVQDFEQLQKPLLDLVNRQKDLVKQSEELDKQFKILPKSIQENVKIIAAFEARSEELTDELKSLEEQTGIASDQFKSGFLDQLQELPGAAGQAAGGVKTFGTSLKALVTANPLIAFVSLVVAGLTAIGAAFTKTERGANLFAKVTGTLQGIMSEFVGVVNSAVDGLVSIYEDPVQGFKDLGNAILENITNRLKAPIDLIFALGNGIKALYERDFDALGQAAADAGTALTQAFTGFDGDQQSAIADSLKDSTSEIQKNIQAFGDLGVSRRAIVRENIELQKSVEALTTEEALYQAILSDSTLSFKELRAAQEAALNASEKRAAGEIKIAQNNLKLVNLELQLRKSNGEDTLEIEKEQLTALQALAAAERDLTLTVRNNEKERSQIKQDELEKDLDILRDSFNNRLTINRDAIASDRLTLEERAAILAETERLAELSLKRQIETFQQLTDERVDINELLSASDEETLRQRIRALGLSEILEQQLLDTIRDRRDVINDLNESSNILSDAQNKSLVDGINAARDLSIAGALQAGGVASELEDEITKITLQKQKERIEEELRQEQAKANTSLAIEAALKRELEETKLEIERNANAVSLQARINTIKAIEAAQIKSALETTFSSNEEENERQRAAAIAKIRLDAAKEVAQAELELLDLTASERAQKEAEIAQKTVDINDNKAEQIKTQEQKVIDAVSNSLNSLTTVLQTVGQASQARLENETRDINARYDAEVEAAQGNAAEIERINEEREESLRQVEREAFERNKRLQIANAIIAGAQAIISALSLPPPFNLIQAAVVAATTAAQIGIISNTQFAKGGVIEAGTHASGNDAKYVQVGGNSGVSLQGNEGVIEHKGMQSSEVHNLTGTTSEIASHLNSIYGKEFKKKFIVNSGRFRVGEKAPPEPMFNVSGSIGRQQVQQIVNAQFEKNVEIDYNKLAEIITKNTDKSISKVLANMPREIDLNKVKKGLRDIQRTQQNARK